ncbi:MAG: hypothetical protein KDN05_12985, partial [Verrucomicrobiae bacterium]|nr:hypothetical protein [Verrucomicrobiae bacterium]
MKSRKPIHATIWPAVFALTGVWQVQATVTPYTADANTVYLLKFEDTPGSSSTASNSGGTGLLNWVTENGGNDWNDAPVTDVIDGSTSATGFGSAANLYPGSAQRGICLDVTGNGDFQDSDEGANADNASITTFAGTNNAFTFECIVQTSAANNAMGTHWDLFMADGDNGFRNFQFRINSGGEVKFDSIESGGTDSSGLNVTFGANEWYHVALTYTEDGVGGANYAVYWTPINNISTEAQLLGSWSGSPISTAKLSPFVIGNEARDSGGEVFRGLIDEVRISNVVRASTDMLFSFVDVEPDGMDDGWEIDNGLIVGVDDSAGDADSNGGADGLSNVLEYDNGTDPQDSDSDDDGVNDGNEFYGTLNVNFFNEPTDPNEPDSDGDGLTDGEEISGSENPVGPNDPTDPNLVDTDGDGWDDPIEFLYGKDANDYDDVPAVYELINADKRNGSFSLLNGAPSGAKASHWDTDPDGDVDNWTVWTELSTAENDSGREANGVGYMQNGNATRNMTTYVPKAGDILRLTWDRDYGGGPIVGQFVYYNGANYVALSLIDPAAKQETDSGVNGDLIYVVPSGSPAIGNPIGVGFSNNSGGWDGFDNVVFSVQDADSDGDGLSDFWENKYFGLNDENPIPSDLTAATGTGAPFTAGDNDGDGYDNLAEQEAGSDPTLASSNPGDLDSDGLADAWEETHFGSVGAYDGTDDPDHDFCTNELEETEGTHPNDATDWPDTDSDDLNDGWEERFAAASNKDGVIDAGELDILKGDAGQGGPGSADPDADGANNTAEMNAGSDPEDASWTPVMLKLAHRWSFNGDLTDSVGGSNAQILNDSAGDLGNSSTLGGSAVTLDGGTRATSDYVNLGSNLIGGKETPVTVELWVTQHSVQNWSRMFSFGNNTAENLFMSLTQGTDINTDRVEWKDAATTNGNDTNAPYTLDTQFHVVMTLVPAVNTAGDEFPLYSGTRVTWYSAPVGDDSGVFYAKGTFDTTNFVADLNDVANNLGRSFYGDNTANATYDEVRIYDGALTGSGVQTNGFTDSAGPDDVNPLADTADDDGLYDAWENHYFAGTGGQNGSSTTGDADAYN